MRMRLFKSSCRLGLGLASVIVRPMVGSTKFITQLPVACLWGGTQRPTNNGPNGWSSCHQVSELHMSSSGWDIAMRNIDAEFDLPQFEASALVRKIAANHFRLP